ncbi:SDR family oxidoreductase [Streptomyces sp. NPDC056835]|uniref:SDR family oxidoreductase n=1 Tax=Streptomyces sp. NPDC056835 TaxID=3345956 RepID=UPI00369B5304
MLTSGFAPPFEAGRQRTSSGTSRVALPDPIGHTMTKGAIDALTLPLTQHLGPRGITVNTVVPATTDTDMNASRLRGNSELIVATGGFRL